MTDLITTLTNRIEKTRLSNKNACKNYASKANALKATAVAAQITAEHFSVASEGVRPARFVVFYIESWGRWVGCIDLSEVIGRNEGIGGYLGICGELGFYSY